MKIYSAYKPMSLDNESDTAPPVTEKSAASGRQEKSKVGCYHFSVMCEFVKMKP